MEAGQQELWTRSGVRLRRVGAAQGPWNWLFVPGGPGLGSESLLGLVEAARVTGPAWLVDLPGDGSNRGPSAGAGDPYAGWPDVLVEAAQALDRVVMVGHSTGGMLMLSAPGLEPHLAGMVLVSSAPHAGWRDGFGRWALSHPIPAVDAAAERYARRPDDESLRELTLAAAPWSFTERALPAGRRLLRDLPYNHRAVAWADAHFDATYQARWAPRRTPTLIVGGAEDRLVDQGLWRDTPDFNGPGVLRRCVDGAGHFPWTENPEGVRAAFAELTGLLAAPAG